jgi:electron transfer flavoprotein beta subunit
MDPETGTIIRAGVETVVNPLDLYAIESALRLKELYGGSITAITMGPPSAMRALREAVAMGCDEAALLSDRAFGGADTHATSYTLSQGIRALGGFDIIITGERATDGDTAQVGAGIAAWLDIPMATYISKIEGVEGGKISMERMVEEGYQLLTTKLPCCISVVKAVGTPRLPTLKGKIKSMDLVIPTFTASNIDIKAEYIGLKGSPTKVVKIANQKITRSGKTVKVEDEISLKAAVDEFVTILDAKGAL